MSDAGAALRKAWGDLVASLGDATTYIPEARALLCNIRKGVA